MDELVKSLADSYRSGAAQKPAAPGDGWTSPPFSIVIMEINGGSGSNDALIEKINQGLSPMPASALWSASCLTRCWPN
jgi:hypothetical protein